MIYNCEHQNKRFINFFGNFWLRHIFQERIALKAIEINQKNLRVEFLALDVDFNSLSLDLLDSKRFAHASVKEVYPVKSRYFNAVIVRL